MRSDLHFALLAASLLLVSCGSGCILVSAMKLGQVRRDLLKQYPWLKDSGPLSVFYPWMKVDRFMNAARSDDPRVLAARRIGLIGVYLMLGAAALLAFAAAVAQ